MFGAQILLIDPPRLRGNDAHVCQGGAALVENMAGHLNRLGRFSICLSGLAGVAHARLQVDGSDRSRSGEASRARRDFCRGRFRIIVDMFFDAVLRHGGC